MTISAFPSVLSLLDPWDAYDSMMGLASSPKNMRECHAFRALTSRYFAPFAGAESAFSRSITGANSATTDS
jgi:hypothetical protein